MASALVLISSSRLAGRSEGKGTIPVYFSLQSLFSNRLFDNVNLRAEQLGELEFKIFEAAEIVKASVRKTGVEANGQIDVTRMRLIPGGGTEERNAHDTFGAKFLLMQT